ncbi:hypothetical protein [Gluconacetobacter takamatsuzukensis]|uniref:Uncharacterized protein n=1 Tax=Gluconacetobacter takamatsuzukensis TaxID=1286190 RepID=A0A7W4KFC4_9PROT|nr:hypothetical protein [Gluconacetobacter takamatsuzukensis]MBB2205939.1 hypothetical protein [Gluconacetobacter takamatsuzukensis]
MTIGIFVAQGNNIARRILDLFYPTVPDHWPTLAASLPICGGRPFRFPPRLRDGLWQADPRKGAEKDPENIKKK